MPKTGWFMAVSSTKGVPAIVVTTMVMLLAASFFSNPADAGERPNVVLVLVDNLRFGDIGCFGSTVHRTPNIDRLASEGARLTSFYSAAPVCTPSRASFLTGCYPRRVGMHVDYNGTQVLMAVSSRGLNPDEHTVAELLNERRTYLPKVVATV